MKKIGLSIILAFFITISGPRNASAKLIFDITQILEKASEYVQKLSDAMQMASEQVNQIKLSEVQGFNLDSLRDLADEFFINNIALRQKIEKRIKGAIEKKKGVKEGNKKLYKKGTVDNYNAKVDAADTDVEYLQEELSEVEDKRDSTQKECDKKFKAYEKENNLEEKEVRFDDYMDCKTKLDLYSTQVEELIIARDEMISVRKDLVAKRQRAENGDKNYQERKAQEEALEQAAKNNQTDNEEAEFETLSKNVNEWDTEGNANGFQSKIDYEKFARRYFYDPDEISEKKSTVFAQSNLDRLNRERRFLYINTAVHLMQVAATTRREIGKRISAGDKIANDTLGTNEYTGLASYSSTRIEGMKTLLLYAQIQSARLQYMAAKELLHAELRKDLGNKKIAEGCNPKANTINLCKYILKEAEDK